MDKFVIEGNGPLKGEVSISGAKNAALPILLATILSSQRIILNNVPDLKDVNTTIKLLEIMGKECVKIGPNSYQISGAIKNSIAPYDLVKTMRASIMALGPVCAFLGEAVVSLPGGCSIGARPVDLHIKGLELMDATIELTDGYIKASCKDKKLKGATISMDKVSVTGTENLMMAAVLAEGTTIIENAACEPEIVDLANLLRKMGAKIQGDGSSVITIEGVSSLNGTEHNIIDDRIEAGTYLVAAAASYGVITLNNTQASNYQMVLAKLKEAGAYIEYDDNHVFLDMSKNDLKGVNIITAPHPGFPTDMQAQFTVLNAIASGTSIVTETIFENRFMHVPELVRMGAKLTIDGNSVICTGNSKLIGAQVMATDLRASACLVIAGLIAKGQTIVDRIYHMDRGYEHIETKFRSLGGIISRVKG